MLKRLELVGFKSFADKTRFDFPPGVTAIVGPNGSGKSNVVDAVKWILGEQSAKSLRGGEMADVIFNGSTSRKSLGLAEVSVIFDNTARTLSTEADEIQVTRRVYRDGTGEYLINGQASRLKDIKDLFLGSGAGGGAYCIIEQGRVDALLQASTRDRRIIFEEAAGVSRFRARKLEAGRKLERVERNLQRLRDIIAEVEKQLRKVRLEAAKAQKFKEFHDRLRELRLGAALRDFGQLSERLDQDRTELAELKAGLEQTHADTAAWDAESKQLDSILTETDARLRSTEQRLADVRQEIAAEETRRHQGTSHSRELEAELNRLRERRWLQGIKIRALIDSTHQDRTSLHEAENRLSEQKRKAAELSAQAGMIEEQLRSTRSRLETAHAEHMDVVRREAHAQNEATNARRHLAEINATLQRQRQRADHLRAELESIDLVLADLDRTGEDLKDRLDGTRQALADRTRQRDALHHQLDGLGKELTELQIRRGALRSRLKLLEELESSQEGLGAGVRSVVARLHAEERDPNLTPRLGDQIVGLAADLIDVSSEHAPLIDLALGEEQAQAFVIDDIHQLEAMLRNGEWTFEGRVSFVPLRASPRVSSPEPPAGVLRADRIVHSPSPELASLTTRLLGSTWIVENLDQARACLASLQDAPVPRLVTQHGERLNPDGTLTVGSSTGDSGIFSRKSELRDLRRDADDLDEQVREREQEIAGLQESMESLVASVHALEEATASLAEQAGDLTTQKTLRQRRRDDLAGELSDVEGEADYLRQEAVAATDTVAGLERQADNVTKAVTESRAAIAQHETEITRTEQHRHELDAESTAARVALAQVTEQASAARAKLERSEAEEIRLGYEVTEIEREESDLLHRLVTQQRDLLDATARLASLYLKKEAAMVSVATDQRALTQARERKSELTRLLDEARSLHDDRLNRIHESEMAVREIEKNREVLTDRMREDYQVELAELYQEQQTNAVAPLDDDDAPVESGDSLSPEEVVQEVEELRRKINRLGSVSMESLEELNEVETRHRDLRIQHDDLAAAQESLNQIIEKINEDSRRLFSETYETVRGYFQELFRKLFGGGMADVILENPEDVLESGVEVVARPPGKELRSISLMSGGEKTLTAVALLLAMFQSKPSPFCLLDEVDAALDEANTTRLAGVLQDFAQSSQFIVITHKKRTMAVADVLYGVTMQESGISKRVAMRFEDWNDEEESSQAAA